MPAVGIARLAAASPILDAKAQVHYFELPARSLLNRTKPNMPFTWTINPYRGCEFGCKYCFARFTHEFMELHDDRAFEDRIYAKADVARLLRQDLRHTRHSEAIAIGTATDPYQPAEGRYHRTRQVLEVLAEESGRRITLITKSDRIIKDVALLQRVAARNRLSVGMTITTLDPALARLLEPRAPHPELRLKAVRALTAAGIATGVLPSPILPLITDQEQKLDGLARAARDAGASFFGGGILFLMPAAQRSFFPFLREHFPHLLRRYEERYQAHPYLRGAYVDTLRARLSEIRERYGLSSMSAKEEIEQPPPSAQLQLFPIWENQ